MSDQNFIEQMSKRTKDNSKDVFVVIALGRESTTSTATNRRGNLIRKRGCAAFESWAFT